MSQSRALLCDTADGLFAKAAAAAGFAEGWAMLAEAGFADLMTPEARGGFGGDWGDAFAVMRLAGCHCLPLPLCEAIVARAAIGAAGAAAPDGIVGLADRVDGRLVEGRFTGTLRKVAWGRALDAVLAECDGRMILLAVAGGRVGEEGCNIAGEPRDTLVFDEAEATVVAQADVRLMGAFARVAQAAGALDAALEMAIEHANARQQFGRPLSKLQAVQQALAIAATEAAAVNTAGQAAALAMDARDAAFEIGAAKWRTNRAIGVATAIVHQVHGAIGFTEEYPLNPFTRRLMSWRSEFGGEHDWSMRIGRIVARQGAQGFWEEMTRRSDRAGRAA